MTERACRFDGGFTDGCTVHSEPGGQHFYRADICDIGLAEFRAQLDKQTRVIGHIKSYAEGMIQSHDWEGCGTCEEARVVLQALSPTKEA